MSGAKKYRHLQLSPETYDRLKRAARSSNHSIIRCLDVIAYHWEFTHLKLMSDEEKQRYLAGDMGFEEAHDIRGRHKKSDAAARMSESHQPIFDQLPT
jgi:hypothetical protein